MIWTSFLIGYFTCFASFLFTLWIVTYLEGDNIDY